MKKVGPQTNHLGSLTDVVGMGVPDLKPLGLPHTGCLGSVARRLSREAPAGRVAVGTISLNVELLRGVRSSVNVFLLSMQPLR